MGIRREVRGGVAWLTLDRPAVRNALSLETARALTADLADVDRNAEVRAVVVTGSGDHVFASGADLTEMQTAMGTPDAARRYDVVFDAMYTALESCRVPTIARIGGHAIGGGCFLALACDLRIATATALFGVPAVRVGVGLAPSEMRRLVSSVGPWRAKWLLFTGARLTAAEAQAWGLVDQVVGGDGLDAAVGRVVEDIAKGAPLAIGAAKRMVGAVSAGAAIDESVLRDAYDTVYGSADLREGISAFLEKRPARFRGI